MFFTFLIRFFCFYDKKWLQLNTSYIFFLVRGIEESMLLTPPTLLLTSYYLIYVSNSKHQTIIQQTGVPDTKINPKGIGEFYDF